MKKTATWYAIVLAIFNIVLAQATCYLATAWTTGIRILGPAHVFAATQDYLWFWWWPHLFALVSIVLALVSVFSRMPDAMVYKMMIVMLVVEAIILFAAQLFLVLPLIGTNYRH